MKRILTREEKDKKVRRNQLIIGLILILVMVFGTVGYAFNGKESENTNKLEYNGITFLKDSSDYWSFKVQGQEFITKYNPKEVENINFISSLSINDYLNKPLYLVGNPSALSEIGRNLNSFILRMQNACIPEQECEEGLPMKNCSVDNILVVKEPEDEDESISIEENCVFITAAIENQTRYADAFLFKILGI